MATLQEAADTRVSAAQNAQISNFLLNSARVFPRGSEATPPPVLFPRHFRMVELLLCLLGSPTERQKEQERGTNATPQVSRCTGRVKHILRTAINTASIHVVAFFLRRSAPCTLHSYIASFFISPACPPPCAHIHVFGHHCNLTLSHAQRNRRKLSSRVDRLSKVKAPYRKKCCRTPAVCSIPILAQCRMGKTGRARCRVPDEHCLTISRLRRQLDHYSQTPFVRLSTSDGRQRAHLSLNCCCVNTVLFEWGSQKLHHLAKNELLRPPQAHQRV